MKEGLAKSIVVTFPQFQKLVAVPSQTPWVSDCLIVFIFKRNYCLLYMLSFPIFQSHIVSNIQNIFKRILSSLPVEERPRKGKKQVKSKLSLKNSDVNVSTIFFTGDKT